MAAPTAPASFSSLPVELRTKIFRYVLPARKVTPLLLSHEWLRSDQPPQCGGQRQILRVSKAFNIDAAPILYNDSLFRFNDAFELVLFLQMIKTKNAAYLKSIKVEELCSFSKRNKEVDLGQGQCISWRQFAETLASACPNLTHLAVGEVPLKIGNEWVSARLKNFQAGLYELPMLRNVYYSNFDTVLTARPSKVNQKSFKYTKIDIVALISDLKDQAKARRSAGAKKAAVTRRINKERARAAARAATT